MLLYHGTSAKFLGTILDEGLKPRGKNGKSNYRAKSHPNAVYLTDAYAPYFAFNTKLPLELGCVVFVIDTDRLDATALLPDEDALEQASRRNTPQPGDHPSLRGDMTARTKYFLANQAKYAAAGYDWRWSLRTLGTCCYHGIIPPRAIVKTVEWDNKPYREGVVSNSAMDMALVFDPLITVANYQICGEEYRYLMQELAKVDTGHKAPTGALRSISFERMGAIRQVFSRIRVIDNPAYSS